MVSTDSAAHAGRRRGDQHQRRGRQRATRPNVRGCTGLLVGSATLAIAVAGCSGGSVDIDKPAADGRPAPNAVSSSTTATAAPSPETQALTTYYGFWDSLTPASRADPANRKAILAPRTADPELHSLLQGMARDDEQGRVFYGSPVPHASVQMLSETRGIAVIRDCQDAHATGDQDKMTGRRLTAGPTRNLVVSTLHLGSDDQWRVTYITFPKQPC